MASLVRRPAMMISSRMIGGVHQHRICTPWASSSRTVLSMDLSRQENERGMAIDEMTVQLNPSPPAAAVRKVSLGRMIANAHRVSNEIAKANAEADKDKKPEEILVDIVMQSLRNHSGPHSGSLLLSTANELHLPGLMKQPRNFGMIYSPKNIAEPPSKRITDVVDPTTDRNDPKTDPAAPVVEKRAIGEMKIRRRKMNRHKLKKLRKRMYHAFRKIRMARRKRKWNRFLGQLETLKFNPEKYEKHLSSKESSKSRNPDDVSHTLNDWND